MRKIPTVLRRDPENMARVLLEVTPGCEWVLAGEGVATRKFDGTCVMLDDNGGWWARREVKPGREAPAWFVELATDEATGKTVGWQPIGSSPFARWHADAIAAHIARGGRRTDFHPGTFELCGPKVNGNPEGFETHVLIRHADAMTLRSIHDLDTPAALERFVRWAGEEGYEGVVWHHPDGRMAKLKARDLPREG